MVRKLSYNKRQRIVTLYIKHNLHFNDKNSNQYFATHFIQKLIRPQKILKTNFKLFLKSHFA